jgi:ATP-dependent helicase/nuclease subunit A
MKFSTAQEAALELNKNMLVQANAGSGKTTVMAERFIRLLQENKDLDPSAILTITFTNLAAHELKERIITRLHTVEDSQLLLEKTLSQFNALPITTIHGFCSMVLRQYPLQAELDPDFRIVEPQEAQLLFMEAVDLAIQEFIEKNDAPLKRLLVSISKSKLLNYLYDMYLKKDISVDWAKKFTEKSPASFLPQDLDLEDVSLNYTKDICTLFMSANDHYNSLKLKRGFLDYQDLLIHTQDLMSDEKTLRSLQDAYSHIMVDEFQDTDPVQWDIIQKLCDAFRPLDAKKLFIVGDVKQSIYGFRGADFDLFKTVSSDFKATKEQSTQVILADNYRTQALLIDFLNPLFERLFDATMYSPLIANRTDKIEDPVGYYLCDEDSKPNQIADKLGTLVEQILIENPGYNSEDIAILSRRKSPLKAVKTALDELGIPATLLSDSGFFQKEPVLDILALLRGLINPSDQLAWTRVLQSPLFKLSADDLFKLYVSEATWPGAINRYSKKELSQFGLYGLVNWTERAKDIDPVSIIRDMLLETNAWAQYQSISDSAPEDINTTLDWLDSCFEKSRGSRYQFLQLVSSFIEHNNSPSTKDDSSKTGVKLLTIHAAKGLEFPIVIFADIHSRFNFSSSAPLLISKHGMQLNITDHKEGSPYRSHILAKIKADAIEEEKRLFYVACTRAKDKLVFFGKVRKEKSTPESYLDFLNQHTSIKPKAVSPQFKQDTLFSESTPIQKKTLEKPTIISESPPSKTGLRILSVSQIEGFLTCSKQFYLSPLLKHMSAQDNLIQGSSDYGSVLHAHFSSLLDNALAAPDIAPAFRSRIDEETDLFKEQDHWKNAHGADQTLVEKSFSIAIGKLVLQGRLDLAYLKDGTWTIVDFKTSQSDSNFGSYKRQLELYGIALSKLVSSPKIPISLQLYYTKLGVSHSFELTEKRLIEIEETLSTIPEKIFTRHFEAPTRSVCENCAVFNLNNECGSQIF